MGKIEKYVEELKNVLETKNIAKLEDFLSKWAKKGVIDKDVYNRFMMSPQEIKYGSMCKMICARVDVNESTKEWARDKLKELGMAEW